MRKQSSSAAGLFNFTVLAGSIALAAYAWQQHVVEWDNSYDNGTVAAAQAFVAGEIDKPEPVQPVVLSSDTINDLYPEKLDAMAVLFADNYCHLYPNRKVCKKGGKS